MFHYTYFFNDAVIISSSYIPSVEFKGLKTIYSNLRHNPGILPERPRKLKKKKSLIKTTGLSTELRTRHLLNKNQECLFYYKWGISQVILFKTKSFSIQLQLLHHVGVHVSCKLKCNIMCMETPLNGYKSL